MVNVHHAKTLSMTNCNMCIAKQKHGLNISSVVIDAKVRIHLRTVTAHITFSLSNLANQSVKENYVTLFLESSTHLPRMIYYKHIYVVYMYVYIRRNKLYSEIE